MSAPDLHASDCPAVGGTGGWRPKRGVCNCGNFYRQTVAVIRLDSNTTPTCDPLDLCNTGRAQPDSDPSVIPGGLEGEP